MGVELLTIEQVNETRAQLFSELRKRAKFEKATAMNLSRLLQRAADQIEQLTKMTEIKANR